MVSKFFLFFIVNLITLNTAIANADGIIKKTSFALAQDQLNNQGQKDITIIDAELVSQAAQDEINRNLDTNLKSPFAGIGNQSIDLRGRTLSLNELRDLLHEVENNTNIGNIQWGHILEEGQELKEQIENKIVQNNKLYSRYPSDFIHALLSAHVYKNHEENTEVRFDDQDQNSVYNEYLHDWLVYKVHYHPEAGKYYAITYINKRSGQLVLAHRGTIVLPKDFFNKDSALKTNIKGVLGGEIVAQQVAAYKVIKEVIKEAKYLNYHLSTTGHSLGAWLAELSLYFCYRDFSYPLVKAVTFESPGSVIHIDTLQSNIINYATEFDIKNLNIVTYLSAPNFVNSCNKHVGRVFRLFPKISKPEPIEKMVSWSSWLKDKFSWLKQEPANDINSLSALWSIFGHSLNPVLAIFSPETGKPVYYEEVLDWPITKYTAKTAKGKNIITELIDSVAGLLTPNEFIHFKNTIEDSTVMALLTVLEDTINGKIDQTQYLNYFQHINGDNNNESDRAEYTVRENLSDNEEFSLVYEGHYRTKKLNLFEDILADNNKGSADWYLKELQKKNIDDLGKDLAKRQLSELKAQYTIIPNVKNIILSNTATVDSLREWIFRLITVDHEIKFTLESSLSVPVHNLLQGEVIASYLPEDRPDNFVETGASLKKIDKILSKEQKVIISGMPGVGVTTCALEYSYRQKNEVTGKKKIVRWFSADSAEKTEIEYINFASELGIDITRGTEGKQIIINLVNSKIANLQAPMLFIFRNVRELNYIKDYLLNLPKNVKVIITTSNDNLIDNIKYVKLNPFNRLEAKQYISNSLKDRISDKEAENLIRVLATKDGEVMLYKLS